MSSVICCWRFHLLLMITTCTNNFQTHRKKFEKLRLYVQYIIGIYHRIVPLYDHYLPVHPILKEGWVSYFPVNPMKWLVSTAKLHESNHVKATKNPKVCPPLSKLVYKQTLLQLVRSPINIYKPSLAYIVILVGGLEHDFYFSIQLGISSSQLTNSIIFQSMYTTNQYSSIPYKHL